MTQKTQNRRAMKAIKVLCLALLFVPPGCGTGTPLPTGEEGFEVPGDASVRNDLLAFPTDPIARFSDSDDGKPVEELEQPNRNTDATSQPSAESTENVESQMVLASDGIETPAEFDETATIFDLVAPEREAKEESPSQDYPRKANQPPEVPSAVQLRQLLANVSIAEEVSSRNMQARAYREAVYGVPARMDEIARDVRSESIAKEAIGRVIDTHGVRMIPALAELSFDRDVKIASESQALLASFGDEALRYANELDGEQSAKKLVVFALLKAIPGKVLDVSDEVLWKEIRLGSEFADVALRQLLQRPEQHKISSEQIQVLQKHIATSGDDALVANCIFMLTKLESFDETTILLLAGYLSKSGHYTEVVISRLARIGPQARVAIPSLISLVSPYVSDAILSPEDAVARYVNFSQAGQWRNLRIIDLIAQLNPRPDEVAPLVLFLADQRTPFELRKSVAHLFRQAGEESIELLFPYLDIKDCRRTVLSSLGMIGLADDRLVEVLEKAMQKGEKNDRIAAVQAIGKMGGMSEKVFAVLLRATEDEVIGVEAATTLESIAKNPTSEQIIQLSRLIVSSKGKHSYHSHSQVIRSLALILEKSGPAARPALPKVLEASKSKDASTRRAAAAIMGSIGELTPEVASRLNQMLSESGGYEIKDAAWMSLCLLGAPPKGAVAKLATMAAKSNLIDELRCNAAWALLCIGHRSPEVIQALRTMHSEGLRKMDLPTFSNEKRRTQYAAAALVVLGEPIEEFKPELNSLIDDAASIQSRRFARMAAAQLHLHGQGNAKSKNILLDDTIPATAAERQLVKQSLATAGSPSR